jgi:hypothetical protein
MLVIFVFRLCANIYANWEIKFKKSLRRQNNSLENPTSKAKFSALFKNKSVRKVSQK